MYCSLFSIVSFRHCSEDQQEADETNDTFFWNKVMLQRLPPQSTQVEGGFGVRLVHGFATHFTMTMEEEDVSQDVPMYMQESFKFSQAKTVTIFLVSRRSRHRAGRRYKRRGVDPDGNVANFVETETIIYGENTKFFSSFVQIRGSIPLYWTHELAGVKYQAQMKKCRSVQDNNSAFKVGSIPYIDLHIDHGSVLFRPPQFVVNFVAHFL